MTLWILLNFWILFLPSARLLALNTPQIYNVHQSSNQYAFDLDFGSFEIKKAQAVLGDQWQSARLPASVGKNKQTKPEIDFIGETLEKSILSSLGSALKMKKPSPLAGAPFAELRVRRMAGGHWEPPEGRVRGSIPGIFLASLEPVPTRRGVRLAYGEIWLDKELAIKVTLMESNWSVDPSHWWIAYPAQYNTQTQHWDELFAVHDKKFKKKILDLVRTAYLDRYSDQ